MSPRISLKRLVQTVQRALSPRSVKIVLFFGVFSQLVFLVPVDARNWDPSWSPDGSQIVFTSDRSGNADTWIMNTNGSNPRHVTTSPYTDWDPAWAPSGNRIAFGHDKYGDQTVFNVWVANTDGTGLAQLTFGNVGWETCPSWSPDGTKIVFGLGGPNPGPAGPSVFVMNSDGSALTRLSDGDGCPTYSPDGSKIAFAKQLSPNNRYIFIMNADGSNQIQLTFDAASNWFSSFSPNGTKILFTSNRGGVNALWTMNADGTNPAQLVQGVDLFGSGRWSPSGAEILFEGTDGNIWKINVDGTNPVPIIPQFPTPVGYNPQWLVITIVTLSLVGGFLLRRRMART